MNLDSVCNRLEKNLARLRPWAKEHAISCFRIYDRDIPEFPFVMDLYGDVLVVSEFVKPGKGFLTERDNVAHFRQRIGPLVEVPGNRIFCKIRAPQSGASQYEKMSGRKHRVIAHEAGLQFWINVSDYLDTGLFLDHRRLRGAVKTQASSRRVLNLFCYTGSFSVYAAAGGASRVVSVDLSATYLQWLKENLELNKLPLTIHEMVQTDAREFLTTHRGRYDIIILDPPSFSNSKRMRGVLDLARDYPQLIEQAAALLSPTGVLYFSFNHRGLRFDQSLVAKLSCKDISEQTQSRDFRQSPHQTWEIRKA